MHEEHGFPSVLGIVHLFIDGCFFSKSVFGKNSPMPVASMTGKTCTQGGDPGLIYFSEVSPALTSSLLKGKAAGCRLPKIDSAGLG